MSTAYHVHCRTCDEEVVGDCQPETAHDVIKNIEYFKNLALSWQSPPPELDFLADLLKHAEHELVVRDEYGRDNYEQLTEVS